MKGCGNCDGTVNMIELNDDGLTYTIHFAKYNSLVLRLFLLRIELLYFFFGSESLVIAVSCEFS